MPYASPAQQALPWAPRSETSHQAAVAAGAFNQRQAERYFGWLVARPGGGTDAEAEAEIPMRRSSVCARRNELVVEGRVEKTDERRSGCAVWRAVERMTTAA